MSETSPGTGAQESLTHLPSRHARLGLLGLIAVMYLTISGGAYGLEDAVRIAGARLTMLLCIVVPFSLSLPCALMAAELTSLMPSEGGFYFWVKEALGPFAGFAEAYLTLLYTAVDMAIYPVLFVSYLAFIVHPSVGAQIAIAIAIVWGAGILNLMGVRPVGGASIILTLLLFAPFVALVIAGIPRLIHWQGPAPAAAGSGLLASLGGGLTVVIWNYGGWENQAVVAEEIHDPRRNYARAVAVVVPMVALGYLLPLMVSVSGVADTSNWRTGWFTQIGQQLGGWYLGAALAAGGLISAFSVFEAGMLWVSRMPFVLAREGYLPKWLAELSSARVLPARAIIACCVVFTVLVPLGFNALVILDVFFYMTALALEMAALVRLRSLRPERNHLFQIGGGKVALWATAVSPVLTWMATFGLALGEGGGAWAFFIAIVFTLTTVPVYWLCARIFGGPAAARIGMTH